MRSHHPISISIEASPDEPDTCPVRALFLYLQHFKHFSGPLFQFRDHNPVTHKFITSQMAKILQFIGIDHWALSLQRSQFSHWSSYSFCIFRLFRSIYKDKEVGSLEFKCYWKIHSHFLFHSEQSGQQKSVRSGFAC